MLELSVESMKVPTLFECKCLQAVQHNCALLLQAEWHYRCRCVPGVGQHLEPVEAAIRDHMIPALFEVTPVDGNNKLRNLLTHGVKVGRMNLRNLAARADRLF